MEMNLKYKLCSVYNYDFNEIINEIIGANFKDDAKEVIGNVLVFIENDIDSLIFEKLLLELIVLYERDNRNIFCLHLSTIYKKLTDNGVMLSSHNSFNENGKYE